MIVSIIVWVLCLSIIITLLIYSKQKKELASIGITLFLIIAILPFVKLAIDIDYIDDTYILNNSIAENVFDKDYTEEMFREDLQEYNKRVSYLESCDLLDSWIPLFYAIGTFDKANIITDNVEIKRIDTILEGN